MTDVSLWRITRAPLADLNGEGASLFGGRWNPIGVPCIYASTTLSLAVLEVLVHTDPDLVPDDLMVTRIDVADVADETHDDATLPKGWRNEVASADAQNFGGAWARGLRTALLVLPSALLPVDAGATERNVLINPLHPAASSLEISHTTPFAFDPRLMS